MRKILSFLLVFNFAFGQGVPTTDIGLITQQFEQFKQNLSLYQKQLDSVSGITEGLGGFMNEAGSFLKEAENMSDWLKKQADIKKYGKEILSSELKKIYESYGLDNYCKGYEGKAYEKQRKNCEGEIIIATVKQQEIQNSLEGLKSRVRQIENLGKKMQSAKTQKESQDLANALQVQMSLLQADQLMFDIKRSESELSQYLNEKYHEDEFEELNKEHAFKLTLPK